MLSARAIAMQGLGFGPLYVSMHGLVPVLEPAVSASGGSGGGGAYSSATISMSEWLRRIERRALDALKAEAVAEPQAAAVDARAVASAARTRRRRAEEELLLLMRMP